MIPRMLRYALMTLFLAAGAQAADGPAEELCKDEYGISRCDPKRRAEFEREFQVQPAEPLAKQGWAGVRIFMSSGTPLITVLKPPGAQSGLEVSVRLDGERTLQAAAGPELESATRQVLTVALPPETAEKPRAICMHYEAGYIEALYKGQVSRRVLSPCKNSLLMALAAEFAPLAVASFPHCKALRAEDSRDAFIRLEKCLSLRGEDLQAAAEVLNRFTSIERRNAAALRDALAADAVLTRPDGTVLKGQDAIVAWLSESPMRKEGTTLDMLTRTSLVAGPNSASLEGFLLAYKGKTSKLVDFAQHWVKGEDGTWRITRWEVKPTLTKKFQVGTTE